MFLDNTQDIDRFFSENQTASQPPHVPYSMKGGATLARISFLMVNNDELANWLLKESESFSFEAQIGTDKPADGYVIAAEGDDEVQEFLSVIEGVAEGKPFAWYGDGIELISKYSPFEAMSFDDIRDVEHLLHVAESINQMIEKSKENKAPKRPSLRIKKDFQSEPQGKEESNSFDLEEEILSSEKKIIAIGGSDYSYVTFVAWNLGFITGLPVFDFRDETKQLSVWSGTENTVYNAVENNLTIATINDGNVSFDDLITKKVIVIVGDNYQHDLFESAKRRLWVTRLDPYQNIVPERSKVIVAGVPKGLPFDPKEVVKAEISLLVPEYGVDGLLSFFTHIPWISKQSLETQNEWKNVLKKNEDDEVKASWNTSW